jgi:hypothetical protein
MTNVSSIEDDIESQLIPPPRPKTRSFENQDSSDEWTTEIEELIKHWKDQTEKLAHVHQQSSNITKIRYYRLAIPSIVIPFLMTFISQNLCTNIECDTITTSHIVDGLAFMLTSILSALCLFFNYSQTTEEHFQVSARYTDISNRIDSELARRRKFRTPSDVFITEIKCQIENLGENAPMLPGNWC